MKRLRGLRRGHFIGASNVMSTGRLRGSRDAWPLIWNKMMPALERGSVLDAGCGEHTWSAVGWEIVRCDNREQYRGEKRCFQKNVLNINLNRKWPFPNHCFDGVIAVDVIEHLENLWHFFREATRVSCGFIIVATPNTTSEVSKALFERYDRFWSFTENSVRFSHHITPIFLWQLQLAARRCGWKIDKIRYTNTPFYQVKECPDVDEIIESQPGKRNVIVRAVSPLFKKIAREQKAV